MRIDVGGWVNVYQGIAVSGGETYSRTIDQMPDQAVLDEIDAKVDMAELERVLLHEGVVKFANPHKDLIKLIGQKRSELVGS